MRPGATTRHVVEVELTQKRAECTRSILTGYARRRGLAAADVGLDEGLPVFRAHALPGFDVAALPGRRSPPRWRQGRKSRSAAARPHRRAEQVAREPRGRVPRPPGGARREEARLPNRLRRAVRGY